MCVKLSLSVCPVQMRKEKGWNLEGREAGRKKSQEVYISRRPMRGATPSGRIQTKFGKWVRLADVFVYSYIVITRVVSVQGGVKMSMLP